MDETCFVQVWRRSQFLAFSLGVPAGDFGLRQVIRVGPMSGKSNVVYWLREHGYEATDERVERLFLAAKGASGLLEDGRGQGERRLAARGRASAPLDHVLRRVAHLLRLRVRVVR